MVVDEVDVDEELALVDDELAALAVVEVVDTSVVPIPLVCFELGFSAPMIMRIRATPTAAPVTIHFVFLVQSGFSHTSATPIGQQHSRPMITTATCWYHCRGTTVGVTGGVAPPPPGFTSSFTC